MPQEWQRTHLHPRGAAPPRGPPQGPVEDARALPERGGQEGSKWRLAVRPAGPESDVSVSSVGAPHCLNIEIQEG